MSEVFPFGGYRYNPEKIDDFKEVVTPPYDKINAIQQQQFYNQSPYNIVRLILGKGEDPYSDRYEEAAENLKKWINDDILKKDEKPVFYAYCQEYEINGETKKRKGFIGLGKIEGEEGVKHHEETLKGPKADRLNLIRATEANFGHIFMLYSDKEKAVIKALANKIETEPLMEVTDQKNNTHQLWKIEDENLMELIKEKMSDKKLYIADGHHRYQTAFNFKKECEEKGYSGDFDKRMMTFVNMDDPGLTILPTHRLLYGLENFNPVQLLNLLEEDFTVNNYTDKRDMFQKIDNDKNQKHTFGFKASGTETYHTLTLKDESLMDDLIPGKSDTWKHLDVAILHKAILDKYLDIDEEDLQEQNNVDYVRYREQALEKLRQKSYQAAFILNPTSVKEVKAVADKGERMPQKSTDFYPKLLTGLTLHKLNINKE